MMLFKFLFKLTKNILRSSKKVEVTENYTEPDYQNTEEQDEKPFDNESISNAVDWASKKIQQLEENDEHLNAIAVAEEFYEWIDVPDGTEKIDYISLENNDWTDEQEIDVQ